MEKVLKTVIKISHTSSRRACLFFIQIQLRSIKNFHYDFNCFLIDSNIQSKWRQEKWTLLEYYFSFNVKCCRCCHRFIFVYRKIPCTYLVWSFHDYAFYSIDIYTFYKEKIYISGSSEELVGRDLCFQLNILVFLFTLILPGF